MLSSLLADLTRISLFDHRLFRGGASALFCAFFVIITMPYFIRFLHRIDATSDFDQDKQPPSPPIMGGVLIIISVVLSTLMFARLNGYSIPVLVILCAYALIGAMDDLAKVNNKKLVREGKLSKKDYQDKADGLSSHVRLILYFGFSLLVAMLAYKLIPVLDSHLTVPFVKPDIWFPRLPNWAFVLLMCFVTTSTANGANFTDGLDTLVSIPFITTAAFIGIVAYISGNAIFAKYLLLPFLPGVDELLPIAMAIVGSMLAYLWFNCPPAQIYLGDAGSIGLGGAIGMMFILIKAELFLPLVGIIFVAEAASSSLQMGYFKLTKRFSKEKAGRRIFLRAPLHDHYRLKWKDHFGSMPAATSKVIWRFHLVSILALLLGSLIFFKVR